MRRYSEALHSIAAGKLLLSASVLATISVGSARAQQTTGVPGSPSATTTTDGRYLPAPPPPFGGVINLGAELSKPFWPPTVVPPKGAPNVLLIITDDQGYGVSGTFGRVIPTPTMDQIAEAGLRFTEFYRALLALAGGADYWSQSSLRRLRSDRGVVHWLSGLQLHHWARQCHHRDDPKTEWLWHILVWQGAQHSDLSIQRGGTL